MGAASGADVVLILGSEQEVEDLGEEKAGHEKVDPVGGEAVLEENEMRPSSEENDVDESEDEIERRDGGLADGEVVTSAIRPGVVHLGVDRHGD